jgi:hypothetical protein
VAFAADAVSPILRAGLAGGSDAAAGADDAATADVDAGLAGAAGLDVAGAAAGAGGRTAPSPARMGIGGVGSTDAPCRSLSDGGQNSTAPSASADSAAVGHSHWLAGARGAVVGTGWASTPGTPPRARSA